MFWFKNKTTVKTHFDLIFSSIKHAYTIRIISSWSVNNQYIAPVKFVILYRLYYYALYVTFVIFVVVVFFVYGLLFFHANIHYINQQQWFQNKHLNLTKDKKKQNIWILKYIEFFFRGDLFSLSRREIWTRLQKYLRTLYQPNCLQSYRWDLSLRLWSGLSRNLMQIK